MMKTTGVFAFSVPHENASRNACDNAYIFMEVSL